MQNYMSPCYNGRPYAVSIFDNLFFTKLAVRFLAHEGNCCNRLTLNQLSTESRVLFVCYTNLLFLFTQIMLQG